MTNYKAAGIIFYRYYYQKNTNRQFIQVYLQYEYRKSQWSHFGGKREPCDSGSFQTAKRELLEEIENPTAIKSFINSINHNKLSNQYFPKSKMYVYYIHILQPLNCFYEANWFCIDYLPNNIRHHVVPQIKHLKSIIYGYDRLERLQYIWENKKDENKDLNKKFSSLNIRTE